MASYLSSSFKMKRKDLDEVNEDFSDFSLSSPARKIRRLDADLPPIMEEEEVEVEMQPVFQQLLPERAVGSGKVVELEPIPISEEMAIVLFKPASSPVVQSPSRFSVNLDFDILSGFKRQLLPSSGSEHIEEERNEKSNGASDQCMAVVPWVPSQFGHTLPSQGCQMELPEPESMEAEETGVATMDIEEDSDSMVQGQTIEFGGGLRGSESIQQWQQQHCMTPQLPQNASTPIVWYQ